MVKDSNAQGLLVTPFNTYRMATDCLHDLSADQRTNEGKLRARIQAALLELDECAWELGVDIRDLMPSEQ